MGAVHHGLVGASTPRQCAEHAGQGRGLRKPGGLELQSHEVGRKRDATLEACTRLSNRIALRKTPGRIVNQVQVSGLGTRRDFPRLFG